MHKEILNALNVLYCYIEIAFTTYTLFPSYAMVGLSTVQKQLDEQLTLLVACPEAFWNLMNHIFLNSKHCNKLLFLIRDVLCQ